MNTKTVLIVDDEEAILWVLGNSLRKLGSELEVFTALNGYYALEQARQRRFDLVVVDYKMDGMDGLKVIQEIRSLQPGTQTILMTAFGNETVEAEAHRLQVYGYLQKPFTLERFRQIVVDAMRHPGIRGLGNLSLFDENYMRIGQVLSRLQADLRARYISLVNTAGRSLVRMGEPDQLILDRVVPLLITSIGSLIEAGRAAGREGDTPNLLYQESDTGYLLTCNIGNQLLLITAIDRSPQDFHLGTVWYLIREAITSLVQATFEAEVPSLLQASGGLLGEAVGDELDRLFGAEDGSKPSVATSMPESPSGRGAGP